MNKLLLFLSGGALGNAVVLQALFGSEKPWILLCVPAFVLMAISEILNDSK